MNGTILPRLTQVQMAYPLKCTQIACGRKHILALAENGFVLSWGTGHFGQLGHGNDSNYDQPKMINSLEPRRIGSRVIRVSCGGSHSGVVTNSGMVFMWGLNRSGQTGTSAKTDAVMAPQPIDMSDVPGGTVMAQALVLGRNHSMLVAADGRVYAFGAATFGRLGLTDGRKKVTRPSEIKFFTARPISVIAAGDFHNLALCQNGELYSWGHNLEGQCGHGTAVNVKQPRRVDFFGPMIRIKEIACGSSWSVAVTASGRAYSWGHGDGGWLCHPAPVPPLLSLEEVVECIPYVDSTTEDPSTVVGVMHSRSFDSAHNVMLPQPIRIPYPEGDEPSGPGEECVIEFVRCGGAHMILYVSRTRRRSGAVPVRSFSTLTESVRAVSHEEKHVDSKNESKTLRMEMTFSSSTVTAEAKDGNRDPEDSYLSLQMIKCGGWAFPGGTGATVGDLDLYGITTASSTAFAVAGSFGVSPAATRSGPQAPGIDGMDNDQLQNVLFSWCRHNKVAELSYALLNRGLFVDSRDGSGNTPLMVACQNGHAGLCQMLVEQAGANVDLQNNKGNTALHFCFAFGFQPLGDYLISKGADEFATNIDGLTCYEGLCAADLERF